MGHKWIIYFVFVCFLTPLSARSIFRRCKEAFRYCASDKVAAERRRTGPLKGRHRNSSDVQTNVMLKRNQGKVP